MGASTIDIQTYCHLMDIKCGLIVRFIDPDHRVQLRLTVNHRQPQGYSQWHLLTKRSIGADV
jgi:hypothetical protein